jgi:hypothetical protein
MALMMAEADSRRREPTTREKGKALSQNSKNS